MKEENKILKLPNGEFNVPVTTYEKDDIAFFNKIYQQWRDLSNIFKENGGRNINTPEFFSEGIFCLFNNCYRVTGDINGEKSSFDAYNPKTKKRLQIKACSIIKDLSSFGPKSVWDECYFLDFYRDGSWDRKIDVYLIPNDSIYNCKVNKTQTLREQQSEKIRPRFSIKEKIINVEKIKPIQTISLV